MSFRKPDRVAREKSARGVFVIGAVPGDGGHEAIGRFLPGAQACRPAPRAARFIDKPAQRDRGAAGLRVEPVPVAGKKRHFARDHPELRPAGTAPGVGGGAVILVRRMGKRRSRQARADLLFRAAKVEVDLLAGAAVEHQDGLAAGVGAPAHRERHIGKRAGCDALAAFEGDIGGGGNHVSYLFEAPIDPHEARCQLNPGKNIQVDNGAVAALDPLMAWAQHSSTRWRRGAGRARKERGMKLNITVDCTPEEARTFLGLPDLAPVNETLVAAIKQRIEQNIELVSPEFYLKQWYSMGGQATDSFMQMMSAGARAATGETPAKKA